jgi:hypothetical protein
MVRTALLTLWMLALSAPVALASPNGHDGGEGLWGETNDKIVTNAGFILIAGFPLLVWILSIAYNRLEGRRLRRLEAAKARTARADLRGGW